MKKLKTVIFSRVSTLVQENERQINELKDLAKKMNYEVLRCFEEKISGAKKNEDRKIFIDMLDYCISNSVNKVLVWELSRIGRNSVEVLNAINALSEKGISIYIKNFNIETLDENNKPNPLSQFMIQILTAVSEMERTTIKQRMVSGYDNYRKSGGKVGRKTGYKKPESELLNQHKDVVKLLRQEFSVRKTMKLTDKSSGTVQKVKKLMMA